MTMLATVLFASLLVPQEAAPKLTHGPLRGPNGPTWLSLWARADSPGSYVLHLCNSFGDMDPCHRNDSNCG